MANTSQHSSLQFPVILGGYCPSGLSAGQPSTAVNGGTAVTSGGGQWTLTPNAPYQATQSILLCSAMDQFIGHAVAPLVTQGPVSFSIQWQRVDTGASVDVNWCFEWKVIPANR